MLSRHLARFAQAPRPAASVAAVRFYTPERRIDTGDQARDAGYDARDPRNASPVDAASPGKGKKAPHNNVGNREGLGFADQVGSQSSTASHYGGDGLKKPESAEGITGEENISPPSFFDAVKDKLGFKTTADEAKQNRGGGVGVTGTGRTTLDRGKRTIHSSAVAWADNTKGQAPKASREPKDKTNAEQNEHLKHKSSSTLPDTGKGNAAQEPTLPSKKTGKSDSVGQQRGFSTSARSSADHTAESYFKEVDTNKPTNPKVHQVDSSAEGATVARANEPPATGEFSRSGPDSAEYETASKHDQPYDTPPTRGPAKEEKQRYGGQPGVRTEPPSQPDEGPAGKDAGGRKPEGRS